MKVQVSLPQLWNAILLGTALTLYAGDLEFSDPSKLPPPPTHAIGFPSRAADLDALPGFQNPPPGYGEVAFYWWLGDPLTKERLTWQLDQLANKGVMGLQVNYAHSDKGGRSYGLTYPSDPPLFSEAWWDLFHWFLGECRRRGIATSLSDYTLCAPGQGWFTDEVIRENPALAGSLLASSSKEVSGGNTVSWDLPANCLSLMAYPLHGATVEPGSGRDLRSDVAGGRLQWQAPPGQWRLVAVSRRPVPLSIDPMNPLSGRKYIEKFFQRFEDRNPGEGGKGLNFFFSDELDLGIGGKMWTDKFAEEFRQRKGYDLLPELPALFTDIGPRTPKVRLDYADVLVSLSEKNFFRPVFEWHYQRGMIYGCDHGGRGQNVVEFGDYFRTQRWMTGPGNDSPTLGNPGIIKNKVNASIAHLYQRPRVWLEGFHSSGWGSSTEAITATTLKNYIAGSTLLTLHGLYYTTHGGFWEWAPPCNHFRMPYWPHMEEYLRFSQRLTYLLSQGVHRCDVAILYPVAPMEADMQGQEAVSSSFSAGERLFNKGVDFDFMDFESLARAEVQDRELRVSGEAYRVLVLPAMSALRFSTLQKALEFYRAGGVVVALKALPEASDRVGRSDAELNSMVKEIFGLTAQQAKAGAVSVPQHSANGGIGIVLLGNTISTDKKKFDGGFEGRWVWSSEAKPKVYFKAVWHEGPGVTPAERAPVKLKFLCDNAGVLYVNGKVAARCNDYLTGWTGDVQLADGDVLTVDATDQDNGNKSAGLMIAFVKKGKTVLSSEDFAYTLQDPGPNWRTDPELAKLRKADPANVHPFHLGARPESGDTIYQTITQSIQRDFIGQGSATVLHRKVGPRDVYLVYGANKGEECEFRARGKVELWDPWTGKVRPIYDCTETADGTRVRMPLANNEAQLIVFNPGEPNFAVLECNLDELLGIEEQNGKIVVKGYAKGGGSKQAEVRSHGKTYSLRGQASEQPAEIVLDGLWDFELKPTLNNRWGDFRIPASNVMIGAEARFFRYAEENAPDPGWQAADLDDSKWRKVSSSFGPKFWKLGPLPQNTETGGLEKALADLHMADASRPVDINGQKYQWKPYEFSMRWGFEGDPGHQGYHGLKEYVSDDFIELGSPQGGATEIRYGPEPGGTRYYLRSSLAADRESEARILFGGNKPAWVMINGASISDLTAPVRLKVGANPMVLRYDKPGRSHFVLRYADALAESPNFPLAMTWYSKPGLVPFDVRPNEARPAGWYHFKASPGLRGMTLVAHGDVRAWVNGQEFKLEKGSVRLDGARDYRAALSKPEMLAASVALRVEQDRGSYAGAALPEPVALDCGPGQSALGDWSRLGVLEAYSGGAWYRKKVTLTSKQITGKMFLDLGAVVATAEVQVNGKPAGIRVAPPWRVDISGLVKPGENQIEVLVYNTLANHYTSIPTRYRGSTASGLLGPVRVESWAECNLK